MPCPCCIAVCSPGEAGHMGPILLVAEALVRRGHRVVVYAVNWQFKQLASKAEKIGADCIELSTCFSSEEAFMSEVRASGKSFFLTFRKAYLEPIRQALSASPPDLVLADFMTVAAQQVASELRIPFVVNLPGPASLAADIIGMSDPNTAQPIGGVEISRTRFTGFSKAMFLNAAGVGDIFGMIRMYLGESMVLINSWYGLEPPRPLPANWILTGPLLPVASNTDDEFRSAHPELASWLCTPHSKPILYVSTGSLVQLADWQVVTLYWGLKRAGVRAVWSLKEKQQSCLPSLGDPDFWIGSWLPQAHLLQMDAIAGVISHCGWGGVLESATAGKPVACLPFFADQPANAQILVDAGVAEFVAPRPPFSQPMSSNFYTPSQLSVESVGAAVQRILTQPSYKANAQRVQRLSAFTRGAEGAAWDVEMAACHGVEHLLVRERWRRRVGMNIWSGSVGVVGAALVCIILTSLHKRLSA